MNSARGEGGGGERDGGWQAAAKRAREIFYAVLGAPDYERYLEHFERAHPSERPLSRAEFYRERVERPTARC